MAFGVRPPGWRGVGHRDHLPLYQRFAIQLSMHPHSGAAAADWASRQRLEGAQVLKSGGKGGRGRAFDRRAAWSCNTQRKSDPPC